MADAAGDFGAHGDAATDAEGAIANGDVFGGAVDAATVVILAGLDGNVVVIAGDGGVGDGDVFAGIDVDAVGGGGAYDGINGDVIDEDIFGVEDVKAPEGLLEEMDAGHDDVGGVGDADEAGATGVAEAGACAGGAGSCGTGGGACCGTGECAASSATAAGGALEPDVALAVDGSFAGDDEVGHVVEVEEGAGEGAFDAFEAGVDLGVVRLVGGGEEGGVFFDTEVDALFEEEGSGEEGTGGDDEGATAFGGDFVDESLKGFSVEGFAVGVGAEIGGEVGGGGARGGFGGVHAGGEEREGGEEGGGDEGAFEHDGVLWKSKSVKGARWGFTQWFLLRGVI